MTQNCGNGINPSKQQDSQELSQPHMRLGQSLATSDDVNNAYEFAIEARAAEPLRILPSQQARHALSSEFARVCRQPIDGMYIIPSACDQFTWFGLLFVRRGIYGGGIFRFNVRIPNDFPNTTSLPTVKFDLFVFHPNIDPASRRPDLTRYFPDGWKKDKHHIQNVLLVVQRLFFSFDFDPESSANPVAATVWRQDKEKFRAIAKNCVNQSRMEVYDEPEDASDPNVLRLTPWDPSLHEQVRDRMMLLGGASANAIQWERSVKNSGSHNIGAGLSWVDTDAMTYMTEPTKGVDCTPLCNNINAECDRLLHGIERLDLSGVQADNDGGSGRSETSMDPISLQSTASFSSPDHRKLERTCGQIEGSLDARTYSKEGEEEVTDC